MAEASLSNRPPLLDFYREHNSQLPEYLAYEHADLIQRASELRDKFADAPAVVDSDELEKTMTDLGGDLSKFLKEVDKQRKRDKEPTLEASRTVESFFGRVASSVMPAMGAVQNRVNDYKNAKRLAEVRARDEAQRIAREKQAEVDRLAEEARKQAAENDESAGTTSNMRAAQEEAKKAVEAVTAIPAAAPTTVKGDSGVKSVQLQRWTAEITDFDGLDLNELRHFFSAAAIEGAVKAYAHKYKDTKPLAGARIFVTTQTSFR